MHISRICKYISAQQAAKALRPFYFAVHPDRFHYDPEIRSNNEKSLQIFNGYLNDLFPPTGRQQNPIRIKFSLKREGDHKVDTVSIDLTGDNPSAIIELALRSINMAPDVPIVPQTKASNDGIATTESLDELWQRMLHLDVKVRKKSVIPVKPNDLFGQLSKHRDTALTKADVHMKTKKIVQEEIDYLIFKTQVVDVLWAMDWNQSYMRQCLSNVQNMIVRNAEKEQRMIINALKGHKLIFGRGSYIWCNGSLQLGADDVSEKWQRVCFEANVHRLQIKHWKAKCDHVSALFGGAKLYTNPFDNLLRCIDQLKTIAITISMKSRGEIIEMQSYAKHQTIEITSVYSELAKLRDNRLQIPCNVDFKALVDFLKLLQNKQQVAKNEEFFETFSNEYINATAAETCKRLELKRLTWDNEFPANVVLDTFNRLECCDDSVKNLIRGLSVHISTNPVIYVMSDGRFSIPTQWT